MPSWFCVGWLLRLGSDKTRIVLQQSQTQWESVTIMATAGTQARPSARNEFRQKTFLVFCQTSPASDQLTAYIVAGQAELGEVRPGRGGRGGRGGEAAAAGEGGPGGGQQQLLPVPAGMTGSAGRDGET